MSAVDMTVHGVTARLRRVAQLRSLCVKLSKAVPSGYSAEQWSVREGRSDSAPEFLCKQAEGAEDDPPRKVAEGRVEYGEHATELEK